VLSRSMMQSLAVSEELRYAQLQNLDRVKVLPILIDDTKFEALPPSLRSRHVLRFPPAAAGIKFLSCVDDLIRQMRALAEDSTV